MQLQVTEMDSESALLREALTHGGDFDVIQINSFISKSFVPENVFSKLTQDELPNIRQVSVDFKNLDYDLQDEYFVPLGWGLNGFLVNTER